MKEKVSVEIDSREDSGVIVDLLAEFAANDEVEESDVEELPAGDIGIGPVGFERKTMSDFASSMLENRLISQAHKMEQHYEHPYWLIEGSMVETENPLDAVTSNISPAALRGAMASLMARRGQPVILCSNRSLLADMAVRVARKHFEDGTDQYLPRGSVTKRDAPAGKKMWACLGGVGPELAERLYNEHGSPMRMADAALQVQIERLEQVEGIGETMAKQIAEELNQ